MSPSGSVVECTRMLRECGHNTMTGLSHNNSTRFGVKVSVHRMLTLTSILRFEYPKLFLLRLQDQALELLNSWFGFQYELDTPWHAVFAEVRCGSLQSHVV